MKFSEYHFYMNLNIWGDFQFCISVPLRITNSSDHVRIWIGSVLNMQNVIRLISFDRFELPKPLPCDYNTLYKCPLYFYWLLITNFNFFLLYFMPWYTSLKQLVLNFNSTFSFKWKKNGYGNDEDSFIISWEWKNMMIWWDTFLKF